MTHFEETIAYLFSEFLGRQGITVQFLINLKRFNDAKYQTIPKFIVGCLQKGHPPKTLLVQAFPWNSTKEDLDYWYRHAIDWENYLAELVTKLEATC